MRMRLRSWSGIRSAMSASFPFAFGAHFDFAEPRRELVEHAVHVFIAVGAAIGLGKLDRLVDDDAVRHLELAQKLVTREQQYAALDGRELGELAIEARRDHV